MVLAVTAGPDDVKEEIRQTVIRFKSLISHFESEVEHTSPVPRPATCMDDAFVDTTYDWLVDLDDFIRHPYEITTLFEILKDFSAMLDNVHNHCGLKEVATYVGNKCHQTGSCTITDMTSNAAIHFIKIGSLLEDATVEFRKNTEASWGQAGADYGEIVSLVFGFSKNVVKSLLQ